MWGKCLSSKRLFDRCTHIWRDEGGDEGHLQQGNKRKVLRCETVELTLAHIFLTKTTKQLTRKAAIFVKEVSVTDGPAEISTTESRPDPSISFDWNQSCIIRKLLSTPTPNTKNGVINLQSNFPSAIKTKSDLPKSQSVIANKMRCVISSNSKRFRCAYTNVIDTFLYRNTVSPFCHIATCLKRKNCREFLLKLVKTPAKLRELNCSIRKRLLSILNLMHTLMLASSLQLLFKEMLEMLILI